MCGVQVRSGFPLILDHPGRTQIRLRSHGMDGWIHGEKQPRKLTESTRCPARYAQQGGGPIEAAVTGELEGGMFSFSY
jgi:hypothetical protein